jgi:hypothetical protein
MKMPRLKFPKSLPPFFGHKLKVPTLNDCNKTLAVAYCSVCKSDAKHLRIQSINISGPTLRKFPAGLQMMHREDLAVAELRTATSVIS